jgi:hypothetical protein
MELLDLAKQIYALRNSDRPSQIIQADTGETASAGRSMGVLLLKPSSGAIPLSTITEILQRLIGRHQYNVRAVNWWDGADIQKHGLMARHYPGFYRVAHGGLAALSALARANLEKHYSPPARLSEFTEAFGSAFGLGLVQGPYGLVTAGISPETLNQLWEADRAKEPLLKTIQRLDDDAFSLALALPDDDRIPPPLRRGSVVLLNGFLAKLEEDFQARGCIAVWIERLPHSTTSWEALRAQFAGKTNPFLAPPETVRGDAARGVLQVETVSILANVIHLSADEKEGRREVEEVWWEPVVCGRVFGPPSGLREACASGRSNR